MGEADLRGVWSMPGRRAGRSPGADALRGPVGQVGRPGLRGGWQRPRAPVRARRDGAPGGRGAPGRQGRGGRAARGPMPQTQRRQQNGRVSVGQRRQAGQVGRPARATEVQPTRVPAASTHSGRVPSQRLCRPPQPRPAVDFSARFSFLGALSCPCGHFSTPRNRFGAEKPRDSPRPPSRTPYSRRPAVKGATTAPEPTDGRCDRRLTPTLVTRHRRPDHGKGGKRGNRPPRQGHPATHTADPRRPPPLLSAGPLPGRPGPAALHPDPPAPPAVSLTPLRQDRSLSRPRYRVARA